MALRPKTYAIGAAGLVLGGLALTWGAVYFAPPDAYAQCRDGHKGAGALGGPFELVSSTGQTVTEKDLRAEPSLLYFGYTYCPDVCPLDVMRNAQAVDILQTRGMDVRPVFISLDTVRDTPETLAAFGEVMHPRLLGLTGSTEQIRTASKAYRVLYSIDDPDDPYTLISHTTQSYLVLPDDGYVGFFTRDTDPQEMADRIACFLTHQPR